VTHHLLSSHRALRAVALIGLLACSAPAQAPKVAPAPALMLAPLSGFSIPVLPLTYLVADTAIATELPAELMARLTWADSVIGGVLRARGPEVTWLLPEELRRVARRAPGTVSDPDRMGQAILRADGFKRVPDPLFSRLRSLSAMTNARQIMVPAAVRFRRVPEGVHAEVVLVLVDARNSALLWRSTPAAIAATPRAALEAAMAKILPDFN
jgi:hypothetical protein